MFLQDDKHCDGAATRMAIGTGQLESSRQPQKGWCQALLQMMEALGKGRLRPPTCVASWASPRLGPWVLALDMVSACCREGQGQVSWGWAWWEAPWWARSRDSWPAPWPPC